MATSSRWSTRWSRSSTPSRCSPGRRPTSAASPGSCAATTPRSASSTRSSPRATPSAILRLQPLPRPSGGARLRRQPRRRPRRALRPRRGRAETPGWLPYDHGYHHEFALVPLDRLAKTLLALCFADATRNAARAAGIDADRLQARVRALIEQHLAADVAVPDALAAEWLQALVVAEPELAAFLHWRCRVVADLVADVKAALPAPVKLAVIPTVQRPPAPAGSRAATSRCWRRRRRARAAGLPAERRGSLAQRLARPPPGRRGRPPQLHPAPGLPDLANGAETAAAASASRPSAWPASPSTTTATSASQASTTSRRRSLPSAETRPGRSPEVGARDASRTK